MAKDKERSINPAQQQRKADKAKALKKAKNEQQHRRNEKLARRNPDRIQRQIDDLKALEESGQIKPREKSALEELERDLRAVRKAREALGEKAPQYGGNNRSQQPNRQNDNTTSVLGKRQHNGERIPPRRRDSPASDTDDSVRRIPMPEDTPPPLPREHRRYFNQNQSQNQAQNQPQNQNTQQPAQQVKTTYTAAPQLRDLKKEATSRFVPDIVRRKQDAVRGTAGLIEPEELDRLEAQGYYAQAPPKQQQQQQQQAEDGENGEDGEDDADAKEARRLAEEEARFQRELGLGVEEGALADGGDGKVDGGEVQGGGTADEQKPRRRNVELEEVEDEDA
jgi:hypothetical protein